MPRFLKTFACLALLSSGIVPGTALAQNRLGVIDGAGMFTRAELPKANHALGQIELDYDVPVTIETVDSLGGEGIDEFAIRKAERLNHRGIYVLIAKKEHKAEALASPRSLREELGVPRLNSIRDAFTKEFRKERFDEGLEDGVKAARAALAEIRPIRRHESPVAAATSGGSSAGTSALVLRQQVRLTLAGARKAIEGAEAHAAGKGFKMNIAAVDDGGHLLAFARMDGARPASVATATTKAVTAATFRQPSGPLPSADKEAGILLNLSLQNASGGRITTLPGGVPIVVDGQVIGEIGRAHV